MTNGTNPRYLTKSRFKLAVGCPKKLGYTGRKEYVNTSSSDEFLKALAKGGYQVGELAKLMFPGGVDVDTLGHAEAIGRTEALLEQDQVTIFEAAVQFGNFFIRIDVLRKDGNHFDLIEVKAKSFDSSTQSLLKNDKEVDREFLSYLQDVAFQKHVLQSAYPEVEVNAYLMMADKSKQCTVSGLNQRFRIKKLDKDSNGIRVEITEGTDQNTIGEHILTMIPVDRHIDIICNQPLRYATDRIGSFKEMAAQWALEYANKESEFASMLGPQCRSCEFRTDFPTESAKSGFHECWEGKLSAEDIRKGTIFELHHPVKGQMNSLLEKHIYRLSDIQESDLDLSSSKPGISGYQRQWMQASGEWASSEPFYLDRVLLASEMKNWKYPFHFIDFETSAVAIPFHEGRRPYEQVAFQFSHHIMEADGSVRHEAEYINIAPGQFPNYEFIRKLKETLDQDGGTIFRWSNHENTVLKQIYDQMESDPSPPLDVDALKSFIRTITVRKSKDSKKTIVWQGERNMYDLCDLAKKCFFHPHTNGSSSIKKVLPAVLQCSTFLQNKYSQPVYGGNGVISSKNFRDAMAWWVTENGEVKDPYAMLPPVFLDLSPEQMAALLESDDEAMEIAEGGAAMTAYARLQFENLDDSTREYIKAALLRYCELDTLAMVMVVEAWKEWLTMSCDP